MTDCMLIGFNDYDFEAYVEVVRSMGADNGAFRDLNLSYVSIAGKPHTCMDALNRYRRREDAPGRPYSNVDFLWPVITYLHSYLTRRGFTSDYINLFQDEKDALAERLRSGSVRTVAITTTLYVWPGPIMEIVEFVRRHAPATRIIVGGPFVQNQARLLAREELFQLLKAVGADVFIVSAEGEAALAGVLAALRDGRPLRDVPNLVYRDGAEAVQTESATEANNLAQNMVDYGLFDPEAFNGMVSLRTAKSCPFACAFCGFPVRAGRYKYLSVEEVERELDAIHALGSVHTLSFIDDTFNVPKKRFKELLRMMIRKGYGFRWNSYLRADHADAECIELMRESGCEGVFLGVESGSDRILEQMNKTSRRADYLRLIPALSEAGIVTHANLIIGFPGESDETVRESESVIETAHPDFYRAQLWYADPTTPIWSRREELGVRGQCFSWSHDTMDADAAADHVDRLFRTIEGSIWLPQYGFEPWSLYYLQRRGLSLPAIKRILAAFNDAVREKLVDPAGPDASPQALARLERACRAEEAWAKPRRQLEEQPCTHR
jgi:anaerobic magnesium-protoporphyrin IX monomethyl ester cyclase